MSFRRFVVAVCAAAMASYGAGVVAEEAEEEAAVGLAAVEVEADDEAEDEEEDIEEVVVTGSFIRRSTFDLPSPTDTITELDIELAATPDIGDIIFDQTYQIGVNANSAPFEFNTADDQGGPSGAEVFPNLRGLGTRATMTMMDGHRVPANVTGYSFWTRRAGSDVTNLYPGIAIGRVETILDGASALYGSEAVSGVINFIPRKNFDGLLVNYEAQQPEGTTPSKRLGLLAGAQGERTSAIFALEIRDQDSISATERPDFIVNSTGWTGQLLPTYGEREQSLPGDWRVPSRFSNGQLENPPLAGWQRFDSGNAPPGWIQTSGPWFRYPEGYPGQNQYEHMGERFGYATSRADNQGQIRMLRRYDPGCGYPFGGGHDDLGDPSTANEFGLGYNDTQKPGNFLNGYTTGNVRGRETRPGGDENTEGTAGATEDCRQVTTDWQNLREKRQQEMAMGYFDHEFNPHVTVRGEVVASRLEFSNRNRAYQIDEWNEGSTFLGPQVAVAIGSNPGNPFRAFADGSNACDFNPGLTGCDEFNDLFNSFRELRNNEIDNPNVIPTRLTDDTFLSYVDANGNDRYDYLQEAGELLVYAQDIDGNGLPDRDFNGDGVVDATELGDSAGQLNPAHRVLLLSAEADSDGDGIPDRFDPDMHGSGGVRLFEDVRIGQIAPHPKQPYVHESYPWLNPDMTFDTGAEIQNLRIRLGTTVNIPDTEWLVDVDWIWAQSKRASPYLEPVWPFTVASLRCQGGTDGDVCWNPFSTAWLDSDPETGEILPAWRDKDDPAWNTATETRTAGLVIRQDRRSTGTQIVDAVASNGALFDLWYNDAPVGVAVGVHYRVESESQQPNQLSETLWGSARYVAQKTQEETQAIFGEVQIHPIDSPRWGEMEIQLATRWAEFEAGGSIVGSGETAKFDVNIPKLAIRYQPTDWLAFRASSTEGFVLPGMFQLFGEQDAYSDRTIQVDYICNLVPDAPHCAMSLGAGGGIPNVLVVENAPNEGLGAEISDLWNAGLSFRLLDGDFVLDVDYTDVDFNGRVERLGAGAVLNNASVGFENYVKDQCGQDTLIDYDNTSRYPDADYPGIPRNRDDYISETPQAELQCRANAVMEWIAREQGLAGATIGRAPTGTLEEVKSAWVNQGEQSTRTLIFNGRYRFDGDDIPLIGGDYGGFEINLSITKMLELSMERWAAGSAHNYAGVRVDGVGNRNSCWGVCGSGTGLFNVLPATPEHRVNLSFRWFRENHTVQLTGRWHDSLTDVNAAWDEVIADYRADQLAAGLDPDADPNGYHPNTISGVDRTNATEAEACEDQDRNPYCKIDSRHYWDLSYSYSKPDVYGLGFVSVNLAMRNIFGTMPDPFPSGAGYESYVDSIMGRQAFARLTVGF